MRALGKNPRANPASVDSAPNPRRRVISGIFPGSNYPEGETSRRVVRSKRREVEIYRRRGSRARGARAIVSDPGVVAQKGADSGGSGAARYRGPPSYEAPRADSAAGRGRETSRPARRELRASEKTQDPIKVINSEFNRAEVAHARRSRKRLGRPSQGRET